MADDLVVEGAAVQQDGDPNGHLDPQDFGKDGQLAEDKELTLVTRSAQTAKAFITKNQWALLWRDADILFQSPRPMSVYENTYVLEPNVQRFTVAKVCNAVVPQLYKGLFYADPPMLLRPRPGTSQKVIDAKTSLFSYILDDCQFKNHTKWGLEQMAHLGTGIFKWGYDWKEIITYKRNASVQMVDTPAVSGGSNQTPIALDEPPNITQTSRVLPLPFFEWRPIDKVYVDTQLSVSDIRRASWAIDVRTMDWYQFTELKKAILDARKDGETGDAIGGWDFPSDEEIKLIWEPVNRKADSLENEATIYAEGSVHHAEKTNVEASPDPYRAKLEILEYWDKGRKIMVLNQQKKFFSGDNEFKQIPFLSSNWWNRPRAFYGMGLGLIVCQNQRVDQGTINSILKIL